jgi:3-methyladenine DNA glycosylase AlkD
MEWIKSRLDELADRDTAYRQFNTRILATVAPQTVIGVRMPRLRRLAREVERSPDRNAFLEELPHASYEENQLHAILICHISDYREAIKQVDTFLPYVDNWATCDAMSPHAFKGHPEGLFCDVKRWVGGTRTYPARFGVGVLMKYLLDDKTFDEGMLELAAETGNAAYHDRPNGSYYVRMMVAWYFACILSQHPAAALPWLEQRRLGRWVHNKTIQKALESRCIPESTKTYLKTLRWRRGDGDF